ncbi:MAG: hypothetical protein IPK53_18610 [bacterium]|nr:hypothetical protein [bacterium]
MNLLRIFATLLFFASVSWAQAPLPDDLAGTRPGAFTARALGLGHTFLTSQSGSHALMGNPALLSDQTTRWMLNTQVDIARVKETRSYPFYDAFDGVLGYNNYALNDHVYSKLDGGVSYLLPQEQLQSIVLSVGSYSAYQFGYRYHEEVRNRFSTGGVQDMILGFNTHDVSGDLRSYAVGAAAAEGRLAMGFSLSFLGGDWGYVHAVNYASPDSLDLVQRADFSPQGTPADLNFGGAYQINERVRLGLRALFPAGKLKYEYTSTISIGDSTTTGSGTQTVKYPSHLALGAEYRPQNEFRPMLYLETELHTYSEVSDEMNDVVELRAGAEQQIVPGAPARFGLVYATSPTDKDRATTLFTAGIGFKLGEMKADFGLEFGELNYTADDLFPQSLYGEIDRIDRDRIETGLFRGMISLSWELWKL